MSLPLELGLIYLVSEILLSLTRRSRSKTGTKQDRSTLGVIWLVIAVSVTAGVLVAQSLRAAVLPHGPMLATASVILFVAGIILRWWAITTLGRFFTMDVTIEKDHELVEQGPFRVVRHPSYTGVLLAFAGLALSLGNSGADWRGFHSPDECGRGRAFSRARLALRRLYEAHQAACAVRLLTTQDFCWQKIRGRFQS